MKNIRATLCDTDVLVTSDTSNSLYSINRFPSSYAACKSLGN